MDMLQPLQAAGTPACRPRATEQPCVSGPCTADTKFQCSYPEAEYGGGSGQCVEVRADRGSLGLPAKSRAQPTCACGLPLCDLGAAAAAALTLAQGLTPVYCAPPRHCHSVSLRLCSADLPGLQCNIKNTFNDNDCLFLIDHSSVPEAGEAGAPPVCVGPAVARGAAC